MKLWWPGALVAVSLAFFGAVRPGETAVPRPVLAGGAAAGGSALLASVAAAVAVRRREPGTPLADGGLFAAARTWKPGDPAPLQRWTADLVSERAAAHAGRVADLCQRLAEQLAIRSDEADELALAAFAHVAPMAFAVTDGACTAYGEEALVLATAAVKQAGRPSAAVILAQAGERWDGSGGPYGLSGEALLMRGRILATACAFDHASAGGLEQGLAVIREGSGTAFDPVVAGELLELFREPWQLRVAA
ncbi:MAG: hypothetical protein IT301_06515 [Dehalococcoidia bacterium]|nr:hypothetical protein [Dehalococcoidia bacterium]